MLFLPCPHCGPRNASEFRYGGEPSTRPVPTTATPEAWRSHLYLQDNHLGWQRESWYHRAGCRKFFSIERHTLTNEIRRPGPAEDAGPSPLGAPAAEMGGGAEEMQATGPEVAAT